MGSPICCRNRVARCSHIEIDGMQLLWRDWILGQDWRGGEKEWSDRVKNSDKEKTGSKKVKGNGVERQIQIWGLCTMYAGLRMVNSLFWILCLVLTCIRYGRDFAVDEATLIEWVARQLPAKEQDFLRANHKQPPVGTKTGLVDVKPYDWSFRYLFDLNSLTPPVTSKFAAENRNSPTIRHASM